ncbi:MAG TPA: Fur family transcriptional regulator [Rugosimonospora sp.]|nr:Fur family transcriptional regulator [Rugosimonospora sp.]
MAPTNRTREAPGKVRSLDSGAGGRARENDHRRVSSGERLNVYAEPGKLRTALSRRGVRLTRQRRILLDIMDQAEEHLTADSILERAQKIDPRVHRVTVYRTLEMLKSHGLLDELDLLHIHGHRHYYESHGPRDHIHVACLRCGKVREVESELFEQLKRQVERDTGIGITVARVEIGGYCENCRPKAASPATST